MSMNDVKNVNEAQQTEHINFAIDGKITLLPVFAIYDKKLGKYMPPYVASSLEDGKRQFENIVSYSSTLISRFPEDYKVVHIADFDDCVGTLILPQKFYSIEGTECIRKDSVSYHELYKDIKKTKVGSELALKKANEGYELFRDMADKCDHRLKEKIKEYDDKLNDLEKKSIELFPISQPYGPKIFCPKENKSKFKKVLNTLFSSF